MRYHEILCESAVSLDAIVGSHSDDAIKAIGAQHLELYRVGPLEDTRDRGIFFGGSVADAEHYSDLHDSHTVKKYVLAAKNVLLAPNQWAALTHLTGKPFSGAEFDNLAYRLKSSGAAGVWVDKTVAQKARAAGFDAIIYSRPRPPAKLELQIVKFHAKALQITSDRHDSPRVGP